MLTIEWGRRRPIQIMAKAAGAVCNMRCDYCYYLAKDKLYSADRGMKAQMSDDLLELYVRQYIAAQPEEFPIVFSWHGGEALLRPRSFYERAVALQHKYARGRIVENTLQTNGVLLSADWCRFFHDHQFLIGISLDGTEEQHNRYRHSLGGLPTFTRVMRGIGLLQQYGVQYNILSTVNSYNASEPVEYYRFIRQVGEFIQFTPIVERLMLTEMGAEQVEAPRMHRDPTRRVLHGRAGVELAPYAVSPDMWGYFVTGVFDEWLAGDVGKIFVQLFDATLAGWMGVPPGVCTLAPECGHAAVVEHNGDLYRCDHYVYPAYRAGNIYEQSILELMNTAEQREFGVLKHLGLTEQCRSCQYLFVCNGECPKNRFAYSANGEAGHNYLCSGYYKFWQHVSPYMDYMKWCLHQGLPPSRVMEWTQGRG